MDWFTGTAIYITIWWVSLFIVLPIGVKSQEESGDVVKGSEPGAPVLANMKQKLIWTAGLAAVFWVILALLIQFGNISLSRPLGGLSPQ